MHRQSLASAAVICAAAGLYPLTASAHGFKDDSTVTPLLEQELGSLPGQVGTMITVSYPPGGQTAAHRHPGAHTFVYVLEGRLEMGVAGKSPVTLGPGQTYYESPEDTHVVSRNASDREPARFLVMFVHERGQPVLVPAP